MVMTIWLVHRGYGPPGFHIHPRAQDAYHKVMQRYVVPFTSRREDVLTVNLPRHFVQNPSTLCARVRDSLYRPVLLVDLAV